MKKETINVDGKDYKIEIDLILDNSPPSTNVCPTCGKSRDDNVYYIMSAYCRELNLNTCTNYADNYLSYFSPFFRVNYDDAHKNAERRILKRMIKDIRNYLNKSSISVSPSLIKSREDQIKDSWQCPSGAKMTWDALDKD